MRLVAIFFSSVGRMPKHDKACGSKTVLTSFDLVRQFP